MPTRFQTVDEYIATFPPATKKALKNIRSTIQKAAPGAEEAISYNMPAFKLNGMLVWYAGYKEHIGFYPTPNVIQVFKNELTNYKRSKGTIQFALDQPLPVELITRIVKYRIIENQAAVATKTNSAEKRQAMTKTKPSGNRQAPAKNAPSNKKSKIK